ncbi:hypothetical protein JHK86_001885 [Glycine max]|nr:hypothetical protein JHK86_001885 [Glycine max]
MWKTNQPNTAESFGMNKIIRVHVALVVDQYLDDNNFSQTHSTFRNEASSLFSDSLINESPPSPNVEMMNTKYAVVPQSRLCNETPPGQNTLLPSSNTINNQVISRPPSPIQSSYGNFAPNKSQTQGSIVTQCSYVSHPKISPVATCNGEASPSCCNVIQTKRVMVSPTNQMSDTESSRSISPVNTDSDMASKRNRVTDRLDASNEHKSLDKSDIECSDWEKILLSDVLGNREMHYEAIFFLTIQPRLISRIMLQILMNAMLSLNNSYSSTQKDMNIQDCLHIFSISILIGLFLQM